MKLGWNVARNSGIVTYTGTICPRGVRVARAIHTTGADVTVNGIPGKCLTRGFTIVTGLLLLARVDGGDFNAIVKPILSEHCFTCHGPDAKQRKGKLRLDVPPEESGMDPARVAEIFGVDGHDSLVRSRITSQDDGERMPPPEEEGLSEEEKRILLDWLADGAPYEKHWAFVPPAWPDLPDVADTAWLGNDIDRFILARLEQGGIEPAPLASAETRLRRVYLDLIGILPTVEVVNAFKANPTDEAYGLLVDELLASPHFGERWGRYWLDGARYADSNGYSIDGPREIWPYRDWVINALNEDKPFDEFVVEQLAGDLLPDATRAQQVATGFHRNTMINQEGGIDKEEFRIEGIVDRVNTTGAVFLGLTVGCAKCHDHKYDPIYQTDYYKLFAFYNNDDEVDLDLPSDQERAQQVAIQQEIDAVVANREAYRATALSEKLAPWLATLTPELVKEWDATESSAIEIDPASWSEEQKTLIEKRFLSADATYQEFEGNLKELQKKMPRVTQTMVLRGRAEHRETKLFEQGDFTRLGDPQLPGTPGVLHEYRGPEFGTRLDLAKWIVDRANPLTARVTVNRYWQYLFGRGLVETENDFGYQGAWPTHPELLDYLANQFIAQGWSIKSIVREMVMSATYQQSSRHRPDLDQIDPQNYLLARQNRIRLDAEIIRDVALAASGLLNPQVGGPGVYPPLPDGVMKLGQSARAWTESAGPDRYRRGMYTYFWRATPHPSLMVFDAPDAMVACTRRSRSNTPLQALTLLNDQARIEQAVAFATRIQALPMESDRERLDYAFQVCLNRKPAPEEAQVLESLLDAGRKSRGGEGAPWLDVARTLFNLDEFITRE